MIVEMCACVTTLQVYYCDDDGGGRVRDGWKEGLL